MKTMRGRDIVDYVNKLRFRSTDGHSSCFNKGRAGQVLFQVLSLMPFPVRNHALLFVNGCFSVASPSVFLPSVAASRGSVSDPCPYPSCLYLPLPTSFSVACGDFILYFFLASAAILPVIGAET